MLHTSQFQKILLADDCSVWRHLVKRALSRHKIPLDVTFFSDGVEVMEWLSKTKSEEPGELPSLIIVDLNMPRASGRDVLRSVIEDPILSSIPVIVMSTSRSEVEIEECRKIGCADFICKPNDVSGFVSLINDVCTRWLSPSFAASTSAIGE